MRLPFPSAYLAPVGPLAPPGPLARLAHALTVLVAVAAPLVAALAILMASAAVTTTRADTILARSAELRLEEDWYVLDADFELMLNPTLEEAVGRGVPLYFAIEFELQRPRWYWLDETVTQVSFSYRLSYNALTRLYRLSSGTSAFYQNFATIEEAQRVISRVRGRKVVEKAWLFKGWRYDAAARLRLDTAQLPKPFQISALTSRDWNLQSEWLRWSFVP